MSCSTDDGPIYSYLKKAHCGSWRRALHSFLLVVPQLVYTRAPQQTFCVSWNAEPVYALRRCVRAAVTRHSDLSSCHGVMRRGQSSEEARPLIAKTELPLSHGEATGEVIAPSNFNHAYVNMVKSLLGIGLFTMPYLTAKAGLLLAVSLLIMFAYLSYECTRMLAVCAAHESRQAGTISVANWRHLAKRSFGPMGASLAVAAIIASQLGVCTSYVDEMARTFESSGHVRKRVILPILWLSLSTVAMSIKPGLRAFAYVSAAAMVALLYDVILLFVYSWTSPIWRSPLSHPLKLWDFSGLPAFIGPAVFAFECAPTALNIYASMGQVEPSAFLRVSRHVYLTGLLVITLVAFLGYTGFGNDVRRVVLFSFPPNAVGLSAQWVINAVLFLSFNLQVCARINR